MAVYPDWHFIDQSVRHAHRGIRSEPFSVGGKVNYPAQRAWRDGVGIEHDEVCSLSYLDRAAVGDAVDTAPFDLPTRLSELNVRGNVAGLWGTESEFADQVDAALRRPSLRRPRCSARRG